MTMSITKGNTIFIRCLPLSDYKNVQKFALKSVNVQRTGKSILQMFAFSFLKAHIFADFCLFCVPPLFLGVTLDTPQKGIHIDFQLLIFTDSNLCIGK